MRSVPTKKTTITMDRQDAVGASLYAHPNSIPFDSGCNLSGVRSIQIHEDAYASMGTFRSYPSTIKRLWLVFDKPTQPHEIATPKYATIPYGSPAVRVFHVDPEDAVAEIAVWTDGYIVNALQFTLASGAVSELYGAPKHASDRPPVVFRGRHPGAKLAGVHGLTDGDVISKLGFTFVSQEPPVPEDQPSAAAAAKEDEAAKNLPDEQTGFSARKEVSNECVPIGVLSKETFVIDGIQVFLPAKYFRNFKEGYIFWQKGCLGPGYYKEWFVDVDGSPASHFAKEWAILFKRVRGHPVESLYDDDDDNNEEEDSSVEDGEVQEEEEEENVPGEEEDLAFVETVAADDASDGSWSEM